MEGWWKAAPSRAAVADVLQPLLRCQLLILDEFGYLTIDPQLGPALYELVSGRDGKGAPIMTSNKSLATWGDFVRGDSALMMAILDRLLHHGEVFYLRGASYRLRGKEPVLLTSTVGADRMESPREGRSDDAAGA